MAAPHENDGRVSISRVVSVHPKLQQPQRLLNLSNLDRQCPILMHLVFFYHTSQQTLKDLSLNSVFNSLKSGLEETLTVWYPGAGRLRPNQSDGKLNLWCNNQGTILVAAETPVKISQLGDLSQYSEFLEKLVYKPDFDGNFSNMPLIVAQVRYIHNLHGYIIESLETKNLRLHKLAYIQELATYLACKFFFF